MKQKSVQDLDPLGYFAKTDLRYWQRAIFRRTYTRNGETLASGEFQADTLIGIRIAPEETLRDDVGSEAATGARFLNGRKARGEVYNGVCLHAAPLRYSARAMKRLLARELAERNNNILKCVKGWPNKLAHRLLSDSPPGPLLVCPPPKLEYLSAFVSVVQPIEHGSN